MTTRLPLATCFALLIGFSWSCGKPVLNCAPGPTVVEITGKLRLSLSAEGNGDIMDAARTAAVTDGVIRTQERLYLATATNELELRFNNSTTFVGVGKYENRVIWNFGHQYRVKGRLNEEGILTATEIRYIGPDPADIAAAAARQPRWSIPKDWERQEVKSPFVIARFKVRGQGDLAATITITSQETGMLGLGPRVPETLNRWRGLVGLPSLKEADLESAPSKIQIPGGEVKFLEASGTDQQYGRPATLLGAVLEGPKMHYFYYILGDSALVVAQKEAVLSFLRSGSYPE